MTPDTFTPSTPAPGDTITVTCDFETIWCGTATEWRAMGNRLTREAVEAWRGRKGERQDNRRRWMGDGAAMVGVWGRRP